MPFDEWHGEKNQQINHTENGAVIVKFTNRLFGVNPSSLATRINCRDRVSETLITLILFSFCHFLFFKRLCRIF